MSKFPMQANWFKKYKPRNILGTLKSHIWYMLLNNWSCLNKGITPNFVRFKSIPCCFHDNLSIGIVLATDRHVDINPTNKLRLCLFCLSQSKESLFATDFTTSRQLGYGIRKGYYVKYWAKAPSANYSYVQVKWDGIACQPINERKLWKLVEDHRYYKRSLQKKDLTGKINENEFWRTPQVIPIQACNNYSFPIMISCLTTEIIEILKKLSFINTNYIQLST